MNSITVQMEYIGKELSCNHYKFGYFTKRVVKAWMDELGWLIKLEHIEDWKLPLTVQCSGQFKDKRSQPDLSNLSKVILDAIEETTGVNDRDMRWRDGRVTYVDKWEAEHYGAEPLLWITISENVEVKDE